MGDIGYELTRGVPTFSVKFPSLGLAMDKPKSPANQIKGIIGYQ